MRSDRGPFGKNIEPGDGKPMREWKYVAFFVAELLCCGGNEGDFNVAEAIFDEEFKYGSCLGVVGWLALGRGFDRRDADVDD